MPKVSVVIPAYNAARFVGEAIQSVLEQTFRDWELIVVDDGSTDGTGEVVASFQDPRIRYFRQANQGPAAALNTGIRVAQGAYIGFLGADDLWLPDKLEKQMAQLDSLSLTVGLVYSDMYLFNDGAIFGRFLRGRAPPRGRVFSQLMRKDGWFISPTTVLVRREVFQRVGLFDESLKTHEDWELWVRIAAAYEVEALNEPLAKWRSHAGNLQKDLERMLRGGDAARLKVLCSYPLKLRERQGLLYCMARAHCNYGVFQLNQGRRKEGRTALLRSLRLHPGNPTPYIWLALSLFSPRRLTQLRAWKRRLLLPLH